MPSPEAVGVLGERNPCESGLADHAAFEGAMLAGSRSADCLHGFSLKKFPVSHLIVEFWVGESVFGHLIIKAGKDSAKFSQGLARCVSFRGADGAPFRGCLAAGAAKFCLGYHDWNNLCLSFQSAPEEAIFIFLLFLTSWARIELFPGFLGFEGSGACRRVTDPDLTRAQNCGFSPIKWRGSRPARC